MPPPLAAVVLARRGHYPASPGGRAACHPHWPARAVGTAV